MFRSRLRTRAAAVSAGVLVLGLFTLPAALAAGPGFHELEGDIFDTASSSDPPYDWDDIFAAGSATAEPTTRANLPSTILQPDFTRDFLTNAQGDTYANGDSSYFATGSKDTLDITPGWQCKRTNNATDKGDFVNAYGYAAKVDHDSSAATPDHTIFFFGLEKDDDNGTNNLGIWLLQDETVGCVATGGGNFAFAGKHENGDLLAVVAYDSGGTVGTAEGYFWNNGLPGTPNVQQNAAKCDPSNVDYSKNFCIITNSAGSIDSPWWSPQKNDKSTAANLQTNVFVEGFLDVTGLYQSQNKPEPCFATALANTRASTSTTAALYDFVEIESPTCGPLVIKKYFDRNGNGQRGSNDPFLAGWQFKVFADGADPSTATPLYTGTTDANGTVSFADVPTGSYDVYETLQGGFYATDPGGGGLKKDISQTSAGADIEFGNACYVDKTFTVTGVPAGAALALTYAINDPDDNGPYTTVNMVVDQANANNRSYTLTDTLKPTDTIDWHFGYQAGGPAGSVFAEDDEVLSDYTDSSGVGTACAKTNTYAFPYASVSGTKYKDADADGDIADSDAGIGGFDFVLYTGDQGASGTQVGSAQTSAANGTYSFTGVAPGTYSVVEQAETGWVQTFPTAANNNGKAYHVVTVNLGSTSATVGGFLNTPKTDLLVEVDPQTSYSHASSISCTKGAGGPSIGSTTGTTGGTTYSLDVDDLLVGTYVCTVTIVDP